MAGHTPWSELQKRMTPEQRSRSEQRFREKQIGLILADMRKRQGLTQQQLAERLGISQPSLSQMEAGEEMRVGTLNRIVAALGGEVVIHSPTGDVSLTGSVGG